MAYIVQHFEEDGGYSVYEQGTTNCLLRGVSQTEAEMEAARRNEHLHQPTVRLLDRNGAEGPVTYINCICGKSYGVAVPTDEDLFRG